MDKLHNIDDLLRNAAASQELPELDADAWSGVEKKLKRRRIRVAALWVLLPFFFLTTSILSYQHYTSNQSKNLSNNLEKIQKDYNQNKDDSAPDVISSTDVTSRDNYIPKVNKSTHSLEENHNYQKIPVVSQRETASISKQEQAQDKLIREKILLNSKSNLDIYKSTQSFELNPIAITLPASNTVSANKGHWEIGYAFTPSISGKYTAQNADNAWMIHKNYEQFVLNNENVSFANSQGINLQYHRNKWFLSSGLFISQRTESINYNYTITEFPVANQNTKEVQYLPLTPDLYKEINHNGSNSYHFVEIPLNIGYKHTLSPKFELRAQTGVSVLQLVNRTGSKADFFNLDLESLDNIAFNETNIAANIKAGLYYNTRFVLLGIEPVGSINTTNFAEKDNGLELRPFNYGLNLVTQIKLRN